MDATTCLLRKYPAVCNLVEECVAHAKQHTLTGQEGVTHLQRQFKESFGYGLTKRQAENLWIA